MTFVQEIFRLGPFIACQFVYWYFYLPEAQPNLAALALKCLPIVALIAYVNQHPHWKEHYRYADDAEEKKKADDEDDDFDD